jgi:exosortase
LLLLMAALFAALFHFWGNTYAGLDARQATRSLFVWLARRWDDSALSFGGNYSHGWVVPLVSLWLAWRRRGDLLTADHERAGAGLAVSVAALAVHWMGARGELPQLSSLAFIVLVWSVPFYLFGGRVARLLFFPCAYLLFAVPIGFLDNLTFPLRMLATVMSAGLLNGLGIPVERIGTALHSPLGQGFVLEVADPCSGIRSLTAMMAVTAAYAYVTQPTLARKWALFLSAIPLAVIGNIGRILAVGLVAAFFGMEKAMGAYHDYSGYVFYAFALGSMLLIDRLLNRRAPALPPPPPAGPDAAGRTPPSQALSRSLVRPCGIVIGLTALTMILLHFTAQAGRSQRLAIKAELPENVGAWKGVAVRFCQNPRCLRDFALDELTDPGKCPVCGGPLDKLAYAERQLLPEDTLLIRRRYQKDGEPPISVAIVFSGGSRSSIHRPEICTVGQGFESTQTGVFTVPLDGHAPLAVMGIDLARKGERGGPAVPLFLAYWFEGGMGRTTPSHARRILWMAADRIFRGSPMRWAYVSTQTAGSVPPSAAHQRVSEFIRALHPLLRSSPPQ